MAGPAQLHVHDRRCVPERPPAKKRFDDMIRTHLRFQVGPVDRKFDDIVEDLIELAFYPVPPGDDRPWWTLVTSGMSSVPMRVREPGEPERLAHAELCMLLPPEWPFFDPNADEDHWPLNVLGELARLPHAFDSWLGPGHVVTNGFPPEPYSPRTRFAGAILLPPLLPGPLFASFNASKTVSIDIWSVVLLLPDELALAQRRGSPELVERLVRNRVTDRLDPERPSVVEDRSC
jgi:hypothetical protein